MVIKSKSDLFKEKHCEKTDLQFFSGSYDPLYLNGLRECAILQRSHGIHIRDSAAVSGQPPGKRNNRRERHPDHSRASSGGTAYP